MNNEIEKIFTNNILIEENGFDKNDYLHHQDLIIGISEVVNKLDLSSFIKLIDETEITAPILDPTLFIKGRDTLNKIKIIAKKLNELKKLEIEFNTY